MNKVVGIIIAVVVVLVGGYFLLKDSIQLPALGLPEESPEMTGETVVTYMDAGYAPSPLTIAVGETVTFRNESSEAMWTASAMHPTHTVYSGTALEEHCPDIAGDAFDACTGIQPGDEWSFTFMKEGTWNYHNHLNASHFGSIVVTAE